MIFDQMGKQFTAVNQDSKIVNQGFPIEEIIGSHQEIPITINKIQVNILSKNCFNTTYQFFWAVQVGSIPKKNNAKVCYF